MDMKRKMLKSLALAFVFTVVFILAACGNTQGEGDTNPTQEAVEHIDKDIKSSTENIEDTKAEEESVKDDESKNEEAPTTVPKTSNTNVEPVNSGNYSCGSNSNSYSGNSASKTEETKPSPSKPAQNVHKHSWKTTTIHHDAIGHYETMTMVENVVIDYVPVVKNYVCEDCGQWSADEDFCTTHSLEENHTSGYSVKITGGEPIYEARETSKEVWVIDTPERDEKITKCSGCGATK